MTGISEPSYYRVFLNAILLTFSFLHGALLVAGLTTYRSGIAGKLAVVAFSCFAFGFLCAVFWLPLWRLLWLAALLLVACAFGLIWARAMNRQLAIGAFMATLVWIATVSLLFGGFHPIALSLLGLASTVSSVLLTLGARKPLQPDSIQVPARAAKDLI